MKGLWRNLGLALILAGVLVLVVCALTGHVDDNALLGGCAAAVVAGLVLYIVLNKRVGQRF